MALLKHSKQGHPRSARVLFLSGIRRAESRRRAGRPAVDRPGGSMVFACPLIDWTGVNMRRYRTDHQIPESPAAALLHRSGECNCGAFAEKGEREMLQALYPRWWRSTIVPLETQAQAAGIRWCRWGGYDIHGNRAGDKSHQRAGLLCESCESRQRHPSGPSSHSVSAARRRRP